MSSNPEETSCLGVTDSEETECRFCPRYRKESRDGADLEDEDELDEDEEDEDEDEVKIGHETIVDTGDVNIGHEIPVVTGAGKGPVKLIGTTLVDLESVICKVLARTIINWNYAGKETIGSRFNGKLSVLVNHHQTNLQINVSVQSLYPHENT